jgi:hypothetical protein
MEGSETAAVLGAVLYVVQNVVPRASADKVADDVRISQRSMWGSAIKETALGLPSGVSPQTAKLRLERVP